MRWSDESIVLSARPYNEHTAIVKLFSERQGVFSGAVPGGLSRAQKGIYQIGNRVQAEWHARVEEQLGSMKCELVDAVAAYCLNRPVALAALTASLALTEMIVVEREAKPVLFAQLWHLLEMLRFNGDWQADYVRYEMALLEEAGFGLELDSCAGTGGRENLIYVSPKSGRAVSAEAGKPYRDKLIRLPPYLTDRHSAVADRQSAESGSAAPDPAFLLRGPQNDTTKVAPYTPPKTAEILDGLRLTGYFLTERVFDPHGWRMPPMRERMVTLLASPPPERQRRT